MRVCKHLNMVHARCPYAPVWDYYEVIIETVDFMRCEAVEATCEKMRGKTMSQEDVFDELRKSFRHPAKITVIGRHSQNGKLEISG